MSIENEIELQSDEYYYLSLDQMNYQDSNIRSRTAKWTLRLSRIAIVGAAFGLGRYFLAGSIISIEHVLMGSAAAMFLLNAMLKRVHLNRFTLFMIVWWVSSLLISAWLSPYRLASWGRSTNHAIKMAAIIICGTASANSTDSIRKLTNLLLIIAVFNCVLAIIQSTTGTMYFMADTRVETYYGVEFQSIEEAALKSQRAYGFFGNPNGFANWLFIPISVIMARIAYPPRHGAGKLSLLLLPLFLLGMAMSSSRSGIAGVVLIFIFVMGKRIFNPRVFAGFTISCIALLIYIRFLDSTFIVKFTERMSRFTEDEMRRILMNIAIDNITQSPVFGIGLYGFRFLSNMSAAHNGFLESFVELGFYGWLLVMVGMVGGVISFWKCIKLDQNLDSVWLWRGWAAGVCSLALSQMGHGSGWHDLTLWAMLSIGFVSYANLKKQIFYEQVY